LAFPLLLLLGFVVGGFFVTSDKGPLLVVVYAGAVFLSLFIARLAAARWGGLAGLGLGWLAILPYVWAVSYALFQFGGRFGAYIAERLESARSPFLASNDQIAQILWFQAAALEDGGFGLGAAPWCGELSGACRGVPPQIQSDYLFTALVGVFGQGSWLLLALFVFWLWRLARAHPAATSGRVEADGLDQAWLSWMALVWVALTLAQVAVTVAGNQSWLPLTGITFPFLSYGVWSLLTNALFFGLSLQLHRRR
jgi:cell division protein FtsW (lipid II flippase)